MSAEKYRPLTPQNQRPRSGQWQVLGISLAIGLAWLCYLLLFATAEMPSVPVVTPDGEPLLRIALWFNVLDPTFLVSNWLGGPGGEVGIGSRVWVGCWSLLLLALAYGPGRLLLQALLPAATLSRLERQVFSLALGLHINSLWMLAIGLAGGLPYGLLALVPGAIGWGGLAARKLRKAETPATVASSETRPEPTWFSRSLLLATLPFLAVIILGAMLPPHDFDVREYHLQVPKEWYQQGSIDFMPHNVYGNMPLGAEMQALLAMCLVPGDDSWWWGALVGKTVMAMFVPLTATGLYAAGRRWFTSTAGAVAALLYVSTPWIARTAMKGLNEPALACYTLLAVYAMYLAGERDRQPWRGLVLAGVLAGAAVACKYPAVLFLVVTLAVWRMIAPVVRRMFDRSADDGSREHVESSEGLWRAVIAPTSLFLLATMLSCGLWLGKNAVLTGNPTYPLLYEWFDGASRTEAKNQQWNAAHGGSLEFTAQSTAEAATRVAWRSEWLSPLVVPLAVLGLGIGWLHRDKRSLILLLLLLIVSTLYSWYAVTHRIDRFLVPLLPLACLLGGIGASWSAAKSWRVVLGSMLVCTLLLSFATISSVAIGDARLLVDLESLRHDDRLRVDPVHSWLNEHAPAGSRVLLVGDAEPFDLDLPAVYNTTFDSNQFEQLMRGKSATERKAALRDSGITHVYVHWGHIERYRSAGNYGFTEFVTHELIEQELVEQQQVLEEVPEFAGALYRVSSG